MTVHPGAALFNQRIRRRVADGPLFDQWRGDIFVRASDGMCVVAALSQDGPASPKLTDAEYHAFREIIARNDCGFYGNRANLRRDLLGEDHPAAAPPTTVQRAGFHAVEDDDFDWRDWDRDPETGEPVQRAAFDREDAGRD